jgi:hypothetical protein
MTSKFCPSVAYIIISQILPPHTPSWPALHILFSLDCISQISEDPAIGWWLHQVTVLWVANWPEFLPKIFIHGPCFKEPSRILCFLVCFIIRANRFTNPLLLLYLPLSLVKLRDKSKSFTWTSCGDVTVTVTVTAQNYSFTIIRHQNM